MSLSPASEAFRRACRDGLCDCPTTQRIAPLPTEGRESGLFPNGHAPGLPGLPACPPAPVRNRFVLL